jgi:GH15 family glucan-1,4-alpha-glucosidase
VLIAVAAVLAVAASAGSLPDDQLLIAGITADPGVPGGVCVIPVAGRSPCPPPDAGQTRWLAGSLIPGSTAAQRSTAARALVDLRVLVRPDGAVAAAWHRGWKYAWPRDSSWVAAALSVTGHAATAYAVLRFIARGQLPSGRWAARYQLSGDTPVRDGRPSELDANGWFPWAVWFWYTTQRHQASARPDLLTLWPAVRRAADTAVTLLGAGGLPPASMDYWEDKVSAVTLGVAAPLDTGLRAAADLARSLGDRSAARSWSAAAHRLGHAIRASFGATGYQRTPAPSSGADSAVTFLGPPFEPADPGVRSAVSKAAQQLTTPAGGIQPGSAWRGSDDAWTPETGFFALYDAASGNRRGAAHWLGWLASHRTAAGSLPEQVSSNGRPASVAPLAWADAIALLAMTAGQRSLPMP